jgi:AbrB family looped-hinge helix DNA binding protein
MNLQAKVSAKGQVVLPKKTRDRLGISTGTVLDVIDTAGGVELRPAKPGKSGSLDAALAHLRAAVDYKGPRKDEADWEAGIAHAIREKWSAGRQ